MEDDGSAFVVIPEQEGTTLDPEKTRQAVREAVESGAAVLDLEEEALYLEPAVAREDRTPGGAPSECILDRGADRPASFRPPEDGGSGYHQILADPGEDGSYFLGKRPLEWVGEADGLTQIPSAWNMNTKTS